MVIICVGFMFCMGGGLEEIHFNMGMWEDLKVINICVVLKIVYICFAWGGGLEEVNFNMGIYEDLKVINMCVVFKNSV